MICAFIGLGQMGGPMAGNLSAKYQTIVTDQIDQNLKCLQDLGAEIARDNADLAKADVIFLCLPGGDIVEKVLFAEGGLVKNLKPGQIIVDTSTIEYGTTLRIADNLKAQEIEFVDAPVSGMHSRAVDGTLTMMCGGKSKVVEKISPLLETMANKILHMGPTGSGQLTKLINQLLFDINAAALAEILPLAVKLGLDPAKTGEVVNSGTGRSYASEFFIPNILKGKFTEGYPMANAYKDLISGAEISARYQIPTPVLSAATATYQMALCQGRGKEDKASMIQVFEKLLNVRFRDQ
ncbi:MAG: NAD(P)-dependent oxidoreductase [Cohaesibacteraceae bacterium]|nr:NAD(P)-dependent oxidoreductase [Cohaesibacteraceae bacterium]MBL4877127.1 NAD(P)-dependent oxidoreductase [Cohaesibacteraceae bacterium]